MSAAWIGVVGSLGGVTVGALSSALVERARWLRAERTRWHDHRLSLYTRFLDATGRLRDAVNRFAAASTTDERTEAIERVKAVNTEFGPIRSEIELLAGPAVRQAVERIGFAEIQLVAMQALEPSEDRGEALVQVMRAYGAAVEEFKVAARNEIGLEATGARSLSNDATWLSRAYMKILGSGHDRDT
jgi:hypothetical protein